MEDAIIKVDHVSMRFNLAREKVDSLKEYIIKAFKGKLQYDEFWALKDVSFEVKRGDAVGLIGLNGSGKSTMLKVIARVLKPTKGKVEVNGTVAPLIELGAGFDFDLTGKENIYLNGALLGRSRKQMNEVVDDIIEFSELAEFMDVPMKNYSSGMLSRLAFAIATSGSADILIVDEVLAVGDFLFQQKCIDRIKGIKIPCPPKNIQDEIAEQCMIIDKEYETSRMTIEEYRSKIESLFVKLNIIEVGGVKIKDISEYITERTSNIDLASYITTDNMLQNFEGVKAFTGKTEAESAVAYRKGDILLSNIRPYLKKLWLADKDGCCSPDVLVFRPDTTKVLPEFLYYSLRRDDFIDFIMHNAGTKGIKMPRGNKEEIPNYSIALPSFVNQSKLITEIMEYEKKISEARKIMLSCPLRKQAVLDEYLN